MSARVRPESGGWRGYCRDCGAVTTGGMAEVDLWADVHNEENHKDPIYCPAQTRPARMYVDPEPAEYCENVVEDHGDYCEEHSDERRGFEYED